jgi:membrane protease YdiL (CAAX protease family)
MALAGLTLPLAWGKLTGHWADMGFTRHNLTAAVRWGIGTAPDLRLQLAVGIPMWLLLASPFQEFFFRGWLQPRYECSLGKRAGLLVATVGFTGWHYLLPIFDQSAQSSFPLYTLRGLVAILGAGLVYGYGFQRTRNIVTPWLAHALAGIMFVVIGSASFIPVEP